MWSKRAPRYVVDEKSEDNIAIAEWIFDSHLWREEQLGYYKCDWCGLYRTSTMPIKIDDPLCLKNPIIKKLLGE